MLYALTLVTPPAEVVIDIITAKQWLKVEPNQTEDDGLIESLVEMMTREMESEYNIAMTTQTWKAFYDSLPYEKDGRTIELPKMPLQSITHLKYYDTNNQQQTLSANDYTVDAASMPGRLVLNYDKSWPTTYTRPNAIEIQFVCGYGFADDVDVKLKRELQVRLTHAYENRGVEESQAPFIIGKWPDRRINV